MTYTDESKVVATINIPVKITENDLMCVACGFLPWENNGAWHWAEIEEAPIEGVAQSHDTSSESFGAGTMNFKVVDTDESKEYLLTREMLIKGILMWCQETGRMFHAEDIDVLQADYILQLATIGELTYS